MRRVGIVILMLALVTLACNLPGVSSEPNLEPTEGEATEEIPPTPAPIAGPQTVEQISQAAVMLIASQDLAGNRPLWSGSGTLISPSGEIVTNCHVACGAPVIIVLLTTEVDLPPEPRFHAEVTHFDEELDLAILQITTDMAGNPVDKVSLNLPYLQIGDSDSLVLGQAVRILGYPGVGGETITFTTGAISGFESAAIQGQQRRVIIKTDAEISGGNSGGTAVDELGRLVAIPTAVNADVRDGVTLGGIGVLRPINLIELVRAQPGSPPALAAGALPPAPDEEPDPNEPNESREEAFGPLPPSGSVQGYISWAEDLDFFYIQPTATNPISIDLTGPRGTDYDLYLLDNSDVIAFSESEISEEHIEYTPRAVGPYWIVVVSYEGTSLTEAYTLTISYDGGERADGGLKGPGIRITGTTVDASSGRPLEGGVFGLLKPGVTCGQFFGATELDLSLVVARAETNATGFFELLGVPRDAVYSAFFIYGRDYICENNWLDIPPDAVDSDLGTIEMSFR